MGAFYSFSPDLRLLMDDLGLDKIPLEYVGRASKASPATGSPKKHNSEQQSMIEAIIKYS